MASSVSFKRAVPKPADASATTAPAAPQQAATVIHVVQTPLAASSVPPEKVLAAAQEPAKTTGVATAVSPATLPPPPPNPTNITTPAPGVVPAGAELVTDDHYSGVGGFEGEWTSKDMATPYLTIVGKTSKAFDTHPEWMGQWLYDKEYPLGTELRVVFIRATKFFVEDLPFGTQQVAQRFSRMADARAAGFNESTLKDTAELDLLIEVDLAIEGASDLAHIIEGDKGYVLARYSVQSTAYGKTASILAKDMGGFLKGNLTNGFYVMSTFQKTGQKGTYYIPVLKTDGKTTDSLRAQIAERLSLARAA
jgi:hypothetical protein